jgi:hypothetical protein
MKTYKVIAGPTNIKVNTGKEQQAFDMFGNIINEQANNGWDYHSMETINVTTPAGCGSSKPVISTYYMLIFCKDKK